MPRSYRRFSREFKMQIVESILKGAVASQIAKANDLHPEVVRKWVRDFKAYQKDAFAGRGKAYTDNAKVGKLWNAFDAIKNVRYGPDWSRNIVSPPNRILTDAARGTLPGVSWVIPKLKWSDHPSQTSDLGPSWVAAIVNTVGEGPEWKSTAIIVVWSEWGGWFDARVPYFPQHLKGSGVGLRIPCIIVSPYAKKGVVSHTIYQFGSLLKFVEDTFRVPALSTLGYGFLFTDRTSNSISDSFDFSQPPRAFVPIQAKYPPSAFMK